MNMSELSRKLGIPRTTLINRRNKGIPLDAPKTSRVDCGRISGEVRRRKDEIIPGLDPVIMPRRPRNPFSCWRATS